MGGGGNSWQSSLDLLFCGALQSLGWEKLGELARLVHLAHDIGSADELPVHIQLGNGWPIGVFLDSLAHIGIGEHVYRDQIGDAATLEDFDGERRESALREGGRAFHVKHHGVGCDLLGDFLLDIHNAIIARIGVIIPFMRIFILVAALAAGATEAAQKINAIVAIVNNQSISRVEADRQMEALRSQIPPGEDISDNELRRRALDSLILRRLQLQFARRMGVQIPPDMFENRLDEFRERWRVRRGDDAGFDAAIQENTGLDSEEFFGELREDMEIEGVFYREVFSKVEVSDEEVDHFLRTESGFVSNREYHILHLLVASSEDSGEDEKTAAREKIDVLRGRIEAGDNFGEIAREYSDAGDAEQGGDLGWRAAAQLPAPFVAEIQNMTDGEISRVISTRRGFHLIRLEGTRGGALDEGMRRMRIAHIFLPETEDILAAQLRRQLDDGDSFNSLVENYSIDGRSSDKGGDLGWFAEEELPPYFAPLKSLEAGDISEPIASPFGIHLVRVSDVENMGVDEVRDRARNLLRERRALEQRVDWLSQLRSRAYIIVVDPDFADLANDPGQ